jgi:benzil reductase ((S)-benzoin forming)
MKVFITGISRGIGKEIVKEYLKRGYEIYAIGRSNPFKEVNFYEIDLSEFENLKEAVKSFNTTFDLAILNAGILGEIKELKNWSIKELKEVMDINVWANKIIIDAIKADTIVAISSGAAVNGNKGWGGYSISKCALNMLIKIYANEIDSNIYALAPGVIETDMVKSVISADKEKFSSIKRVDESKLSLEEGVKRVIKAIDVINTYESGSFLDVRSMKV